MNNFEGSNLSYLMNVDTLEANILRARPLTTTDRTNLKRLLLRPELRDVCSVIEHLLKRGLKLEQEGVEAFQFVKIIYRQNGYIIK